MAALEIKKTNKHVKQPTIQMHSTHNQSQRFNQRSKRDAQNSGNK